MVRNRAWDRDNISCGVARGVALVDGFTVADGLMSLRSLKKFKTV